MEEYFRNAVIYGIDIHNANIQEEHQSIYVDQTNCKDLAYLTGKLGENIDIIIDDEVLPKTSNYTFMSWKVHYEKMGVYM